MDFALVPLMALPPRSPRHPRVDSFFAVGIGVAVAVVLVIGVPTITKPVTTCEMGDRVGSASIWTPLELINIPDGGSVSFDMSRWNWTFTSGSLVVGGRSVSDGGASASLGGSEAGIFGTEGLAQWGFFAARNVSSAFGVNHPCTQPYVAEDESALECGAAGNLSAILPLPNNASDAVELHSVPSNPCLPDENATPGAELWFDTSFHEASGTTNQSATIALCGPLYPYPLNITLPGVAEYPIVVSMQLHGRAIQATGFTWWSSGGLGYGPTVGYSLPNGWIWNVTSVVPGVLPSVGDPTTTALLAFERSACPS